MVVNLVFHIRGDFFTQPAHHVKTPRRKNSQSGGHQKQFKKPLRQHIRTGFGHQALVNQHFERQWKCQGGRRSEQQKQAGQHDLGSVRTDEGE